MRQVDIDGFETYQITDDGRVWSKLTNKWLKPSITKGGYKLVSLYKDSKVYYKKIHRLVAKAFIPNLDNKPCVDHIIPISKGGTNDYWNLHWVTHKENSNNPISLMTLSERTKGELNPMYGKKHTEEVIRKMSESHKGLKHTEEEKRKISEANRGEKNPNYGNKRKDSSKFKAMISSKNRKVVHMFNSEGELIGVYYSVRQCAKENSIDRSGIKNCCEGKTEKYKDFVFKYA